MDIFERMLDTRLPTSSKSVT